MPIESAYPVIVALVGFVLASLVTQRAVRLLDPGQKAALVDAASSTRVISIAVVVVFVALMFWRPVFAWGVLGGGYLALGIRSVFRLRRLALPPAASRLILVGNACGVAGIAYCAAVFACRAAGGWA